MSLRAYEEDPSSDPTTMVTLESVFTNPDDESDLEGDAGEESTKSLWIAMEQTTLNGTINSSVTTVVIAEARFSDTALSVIVIDSEKMLITAGHGTTSLTVVRGWDGTTPASHTTGAQVISAYDAASDAAITAEDNYGDDETSWMDYCGDDAGSPDESYADPYALGAIAYDESLRIHRRLVVPASTDPQSKSDLLHTISATLTEAVI